MGAETPFNQEWCSQSGLEGEEGYETISILNFRNLLLRKLRNGNGTPLHQFVRSNSVRINHNESLSS